MTRKRVMINGKEFLIEALSPSVVKVEHKEQVGWIGISKDCDVNSPFAFQFRETESLDEGVGTNITASSTPRTALICMAFHLTQAQQKEESLRINPEARRGMARWQLHEYLEGLEDGAEL